MWLILRGYLIITTYFIRTYTLPTPTPESSFYCFNQGWKQTLTSTNSRSPRLSCASVIRPASQSSSSPAIPRAGCCETDWEGVLTEISWREGWPYLIRELRWPPGTTHPTLPAHLLIKTNYLKLLGASIKEIFSSEQKEVRWATGTVRSRLEYCQFTPANQIPPPS